MIILEFIFFQNNTQELKKVSCFYCVFKFALSSSFFFFALALTTEAMGIWRFAGAFAVVERQSECGSKDR
jgi:hypothetical protein